MRALVLMLAGTLGAAGPAAAAEIVDAVLDPGDTFLGEITTPDDMDVVRLGEAGRDGDGSDPVRGGIQR